MIRNREISILTENRMNRDETWPPVIDSEYRHWIAEALSSYFVCSSELGVETDSMKSPIHIYKESVISYEVDDDMFTVTVESFMTKLVIKVATDKPLRDCKFDIECHYYLSFVSVVKQAGVGADTMPTITECVMAKTSHNIHKWMVANQDNDSLVLEYYIVTRAISEGCNLDYPYIQQLARVAAFWFEIAFAEGLTPLLMNSVWLMAAISNFKFEIPEEGYIGMDIVMCGLKFQIKLSIGETKHCVARLYDKDEKVGYTMLANVNTKAYREVDTIYDVITTLINRGEKQFIKDEEKQKEKKSMLDYVKQEK